MTMEQTDVRAPAPGRARAWTGWRQFFVDHRVDESDTITSFWLRPVDGGPLPFHRPGQHTTLRATGEGAPAGTRNYTLSAPGDGRVLRISVKREPEGAVSRWLHEHAVPGTALDLLPPSGDFCLPEGASRPLVFLSGGVGITPLMAMLEAADPSASVHFLHGTRDGSTHAFGARVREIAAARPSVAATLFYSRPGADDQAGRDFDEVGHITVAHVARAVPLAEGDFYICGPVAFMRDLVTGLRRAGVPAARIRTEFFGDFVALDEAAPAGSPVAASGGLDPAAIGAALLNSAADAILASDRDGIITLWNPGAARIFGFSAEEAVGQSLDIIIPEPLRARHWEGYHHTVSTGVSRYGAGDLLAVPGLHKDGSRLSLEFTIVLLKDAEGTVTGMVSSLRDVTRKFEETRALRKKIAELEARLG